MHSERVDRLVLAKRIGIEARKDNAEEGGLTPKRSSLLPVVE